MDQTDNTSPSPYQNDPSLGSSRPVPVDDESQPLLGATSGSRATHRRRQDGSSQTGKWYLRIVRSVRRGIHTIGDWFGQWGFFCLLALGFILLILLLVYLDSLDNRIPHDAEVVHFSYSLNPQQYSRLTVKLDYGISGDVVISQSENFFEKNILIYGSMKASTLPLFDCMSHTLIRDSYASTAKHFIFADMPYPELEEALKKYAMRVTLSVVIPRHLDNYAAIEILSSFQGDVRVALNDGRLTEGLTVKANQGNVVLEGLKVLGPLKVEARHGKVQAKVGAERIVKMSASGPLELEITSTGQGLDLDIVSFYEQASLILMQPFLGRFLLRSVGLSKTELIASERHLTIQAQSDSVLKGYFSLTGKEPWYLPRVAVQGRGARLDANRLDANRA